MKFQRPTVILTAGGAALAITLIVGLSALTWPPGAGQRIRAVEAKLGAASIVARAPGEAAAYPQQALCRQDPALAAISLKQRMESAASASGLTVAELQTSMQSSPLLRRVTEVTFKITVTGRYDSVVTYLGMLNQFRPALFAEDLLIDRSGRVVKLEFRGKLICLNRTG